MATHEILLLGDGSNLFRSIGWVLEYKGYRVRGTASPEAGLEAMVKKNFDLVIAKVTLEDLDGLEVLKQAKKMNPEVKVIVVSGNHDVTFPMEAYQIEVDDYILMPVSPAELWRRVNHCLGQKAAELRSTAGAGEQGAADINERVLNKLMVMFHDIRGSMVSTAATLKLLTRGAFGQMDAKVGRQIQEEYVRVKKLIDHTEEFMSQAFPGREAIEPEREVLDLKQDIVEPVLEELAGEIRAQQIKIDNRLDTLPNEEVPIKGSRFWLKSIFRNLLNNGIKYGGRGCDIVIDLAEEGANYRLQVYNSGQPVPEEYRSLLFTKAMYGTKRARGKKDGMGLGLYLSRNIIQKYGGDIGYEPKIGGSNFVVTLPHN